MNSSSNALGMRVRVRVRFSDRVKKNLFYEKGPVPFYMSDPDFDM